MHIYINFVAAFGRASGGVAQNHSYELSGRTKIICVSQSMHFTQRWPPKKRRRCADGCVIEFVIPTLVYRYAPTYICRLGNATTITSRVLLAAESLDEDVGGPEAPLFVVTRAVNRATVAFARPLDVRREHRVLCPPCIATTDCS